ncbi:MAG: type IV secretion system DNA-binding domain-containing protein [Candidatus Nomurabacteria bacterium]|nr:MAG: type IV secretion system DNA-binding domain-containing protein [Candidatus Nomurabacteria bacterium]
MSEDINFFAKTNFRNQQRRFGIRIDDRRRHMYFIGKTGMGKTTVLENMMIQDVRAGHGLAVIDPHGDFVEKILDYIPSHRINDVVYINPADVDYPVAFNVLESVNPAHRHLVASGLVSVFKKMWSDSWGPRLEYILRNSILSLIEYPGSTLLGIPRILVDNDYRSKVVEKLTDPIVKAFWHEEFGQYANQFRTEAVSPIQNKIGQFLSSSMIRNIIGQPKSTFDLRQLMDEQKIVLLNLSKGRIGEDNAALLGGMMITKIQLAAMSRVDIAEKDRKDFFLYVDEFQNFATESFANILSEARKYRLNLIMAHQYIEQLDEQVRAAVFGNVGSIVCFRVGAADAEFLAKEFDPTFTETDLVNLTKYDIYLRLMIDGVASEPFSATTLEPVSGPTGNGQKVIEVSRERYAKKREIVEDKIRRWTGVDEIFLGQGSQGGGNRSGGNRGGNDRRGGSGPRQNQGGGSRQRSGGNDRNRQPNPQGNQNSSRPRNEREQGRNDRPNFTQTAPEPEQLREVAPEPPKEISLHEALSKGPVQFTAKPKKKQPQEKSQPAKNTPKQAEQSKSVQAQEKHSQPQTQSGKSLQPGQVIKFT